MEERLIRIEQLCDRLDMGKSTAWRYIGRVPGFPQPIKVGGLTRFRESDLSEYLATLVQDGVDAQIAERRETSK